MFRYVPEHGFSPLKVVETTYSKPDYWFLLSSVADWLEEDVIALSTAVHPDDIMRYPVDVNGVVTEVWFINEQGLVLLLLQSRLPKFAKFRQHYRKVMDFRKQRCLWDLGKAWSLIGV